MVQPGQSNWDRAAFNFDEIYLCWIWLERADSRSLFRTWSYMGTHSSHDYLYFGIMVFANWNNYKYDCFDPAFDWKEIGVTLDPVTLQKELNQILDELERQGVYMNIVH